MFFNILLLPIFLLPRDPESQHNSVAKHRSCQVTLGFHYWKLGCSAKASFFFFLIKVDYMYGKLLPSLLLLHAIIETFCGVAGSPLLRSELWLCQGGKDNLSST